MRKVRFSSLKPLYQKLCRTVLRFALTSAKRHRAGKHASDGGTQTFYYFNKASVADASEEGRRPENRSKGSRRAMGHTSLANSGLGSSRVCKTETKRILLAPFSFD